ncbi:lasso RiPP family leader peptide-containing protein [Saccharopolyspora indica]|nr:lasso RiPP family leader peptide-containing protein [Saccharopolyspora indica]MDA3647969.1 lasso RiPP family leader peptide-containing protein [Saccharopolyspora indica]
MDVTEIRSDEGIAAYESPTITDAGEFAEQTRGEFGDWADFPVGLWL